MPTVIMEFLVIGLLALLVALLFVAGGIALAWNRFGAPRLDALVEYLERPRARVVRMPEAWA